MAAIAADVSGERASYVMYEMPLKLVYAYEHFYYIKNGHKCRLASPDLLKLS